MKFLNLLLLMTLILIQNKLKAQSITEPYKTPDNVIKYIESQMDSKYDGNYALSIYFIMDSLLNKTPYNYMDEKFEDPYGTLKGISVFSCQKYSDSEDSSIIGIYKEGNILWDSGPIIFGSILNRLSFCKDINKDSVVDIGLISEYHDFEERYNPNNIEDYLWILSWYGSEGKLINDYDASTHKSKLVPGPFRLFDENGDGIFEISSKYFYDDEYTHKPIENPPPNYPYVTYGWNRSKYGLWTNIYQLKYGDFYPAIWIKPAIKCKVVSEDSTLKFQYTIANGKSSLQSIETINFLNVPTAKIDITSKYQNITISSFPGILPGVWYFEPNGLRNYAGLIEPGEIKSGYWYKGIGLPAIVYAYLRGLIPLELTREISDEAKLDEIQNNSVKKKTLGLKSVTQQLDTIGFLDTLKIYVDTSSSLGWIKNQPTADKYSNYFTTAKAQLQQNDISAVKNSLIQVLHDVDIDSAANLTSEAYALLRYNTEYLLNNLPEVTTGFAVRLTNSSGNLLPGGSLKYYEGGWKDAIDNGDGTFAINSDKKTLSLRIIYEYGSQTVSNIPAQNNTYTFKTVNTTVQLKNSSANLIDEEGTVNYYAGGWRDFGATVNGTVSKELLPGNYSFRMTYAYSSNDKKQNIGSDSTVVFQTVNTAVQLKNSQDQFIDEGMVKYYAGGWRDFAATVNGIASKELLPNKYSFRMTYAYASNDKQQNIGDNSTVVFQTVNAAVQLKNSQGQLIDEGIVKYYAGGWRDFGSTINGLASKELLSGNYSFRMSFAYSSNDKKQNIGDDPTVVFQTVNTAVQLKNSQGQLMEEGTVKYYAGGWRDFAATVNGIASKELLPNNYSFRMTYAYASNDKQQNIGTDPNVVFQTIYASVQLKNSQGQLMDEGIVKYYADGWRNFGSTVNGVASKELLPNNYSFRMTYEYISNDKQQNMGANNIIDFSTVLCRVKVNNAQNQPVNNADIKYYSGGWRQFGTTINGEASKELLPSNITFRAGYNGISQNKQQNTGEDPVVDIVIQ